MRDLILQLSKVRFIQQSRYDVKRNQKNAEIRVQIFSSLDLAGYGYSGEKLFWFCR